MALTARAARAAFGGALRGSFTSGRSRPRAGRAVRRVVGVVVGREPSWSEQGGSEDVAQPSVPVSLIRAPKIVGRSDVGGVVAFRLVRRIAFRAQSDELGPVALLIASSGRCVRGFRNFQFMCTGLKLIETFSRPSLARRPTDEMRVPRHPYFKLQTTPDNHPTRAARCGKASPPWLQGLQGILFRVRSSYEVSFENMSVDTGRPIRVGGVLRGTMRVGGRICEKRRSNAHLPNTLSLELDTIRSWGNCSGRNAK